MRNRDIRSTLADVMKVNESHVLGMQHGRDTLDAAERALVESLTRHPAWGSIDKTTLDRHTLVNMFVAVSDQPISVCTRTAAKCERMLESGALRPDLTAPKMLHEGKEVPEDQPASKDGDGEMPQGDAETTAADHDGKDVGKLAKGSPKGDADQGASQDKDKQGDKSDLAKDGYMKEEEDGEEDELPEEADGVADASDDTDPQLGEDEGEGNPEGAGKSATDLPEEDETPDPAPLAPPKVEKKKVRKEAEDEEDGEDEEDEIEFGEAEEAPKDAKDPANDDEHRAANDATYRDGKGQNEAKLKEDDLDQPNQTKDAEDLPDLDKVQKEDPSGSELNKGPADVALESFDRVESRIHAILKEAGLRKGTRRWTEAYLRGWQLAMEHRARRIAESK